MTGKKLNLLYFSATSNTAKVVKEVASGIGSNFEEFDITLPTNRQEGLSLSQDDLIIVGVPVYAGRVPEFLIDYFSKIKGNNTPAAFIVMYGNRHYDDALLELKDTFENNGFIGIAAAAFTGEHSYTSKVGTGRPDASDLQIAKKFGVEVLEKLTNIKDVGQIPKLAVKGNFPYKDRASLPPMGPETNDLCVSCGICAKHCPMGAINSENTKDIDITKCIKCSSCIKRCPKEAKAITHELYQKVTNGLIENFGKNRPNPEVFI